MKPTPIRTAALAVLLALSGIRQAAAQADIPADFLSIIGATAGTVSDGYGSPGSIPVHGRASFPVLIDANNLPALAAGRYGNGVSPTAARAVAASHTGFFNTSGTTTTSTLFLNSVLWASRKSTPGTITVGSNNSTIRSFFSTRGYLTKAISTGMSNSSNDLSGCDVFVGNFHDGFTASAITKINTFAANGGGVVVCCTPWALSTTAFNSAQSVLEPFGLSISGSGTASGSFTVAAASYPSHHSALNGLDSMVAEATGGPAFSLADERIAAGSVDRVLAVRPAQADLLAGLQTLENSGYGIIPVTAAAPLVKNNKPVEAMLARFQSGKFDAMTAAQLIAHPSASDWPGAPAAGSPVSKVIPVNGTVPADSYMNWGDRGRRIETRLYAAPGATLTVTIPADKVAGGITLDIGCHIDENFHLSQWNRFPKVTRKIPLTQTVTQTGSVFGGIVWITVPPGANLGNFNVTIDGALEAPCFQLGVDTDETWNSTLKHLPGAWGCIMTDNVPGYGNTPGFTVYVSRAKLQSVTSAEAVAQHWKNVIETADDRMGYTAYRKRGEAALSDRDIVAGGGHAGWPVMMAYGDSDVLVDGALKSGDWGFYHEIGHTFQDSFDGSYGIATHGEVDVNLVPALLNNIVHDKTCWDGDIHSTFNGGNRLSKRTAFLAMPSAEQTWSFACSDGATAYDFYFNLAEAFGWNVYRTALARLMAWNQGGTDTVLTSFGGASDQAKRDRFFIIFCDATGRNLDAYFQRYGLGVTGRGYEISATAKSHIAAKGYPVWTDNSPVDSISDPGPLAASETLAPGAVLATLVANDPEEPGTQWTWTIESGNPHGALAIDPRSGQLTVSAAGLDRELASSYTISIRADDNGVPRYSATRSVTVNLGNSVEPPKGISNAVLNATSAMSAGTLLGQVIAADATRTLTAVSILSGNGSGAFSLNASGQLVLQNPAALPATSLLSVVVSGTDSAGETGFATVRVLVNATPGLREQRWSGTSNFNNNTWTGSANFTGNLTSSTTGENVADNYSRRVRGWLVPPVSGDYTFWVASDDSSRFYLGTNETEGSKVQLASVNGYTGFQNFDASGSQVSVPVTLEAGKMYWFEAQQAEGGGGDHLSVAWQGAGIPVRSIIAGAYLIPNQSGITATNNLPAAPAFSSASLVKADATQNSAYSSSLAADASDPNPGDTLSFSKIAGPAWLTVASNGSLSGTPGQAHLGTNVFTVRVTDSTGQFAQAQLSIAVTDVNDAPVFTADPIAGSSATEDAAYSGSIAASATDPDAGDTLTFTKTSGPAWLAVAANGSLFGTPGNGDVGPNSFTVRVTDAAGLFDEATLSITVSNVNDAPVFTADPIAGSSATEDAAYSGSIAASATDPDAGDTRTFTKTGGPAWLVVAPNGVLSGTPANGDVGSNIFTVRVTDVAGLFDEASLSITVVNVNDAPVFTADPIAGGSATEDEAYSGSIAASATDPDAGDTRTFVKTGGPAWLAVAPDGTLSGTPANGDVGSNSFTVRVTDAAGLFDEATLSITVTNVNDLPVFAESNLVREGGEEGVAYTATSLAGSATDADQGDTLSYSKTAGPAWLTVAVDGALGGTPPAESAGDNVFTIRATDGSGAYAEATLTIVVTGASLPLPWDELTVGSGNLAGSTRHDAGLFTVAGSGQLSGRNDSFQFAWQTMSGDGSVVARIDQLDNTGGDARVGVMIRDTLAGNSRYVFIGLNGDGQYRWVRRTGFNGNTSTSKSGTATVPAAWVRLVRSGNVVTASKSTNGIDWVTVGSLTASFPETCYVGLAVASGSNSSLNSSQFSQVTVTP
jgi:hypothetical protein